MIKIILFTLFVFPLISFSQPQGRKLVINDSEWKVKIPQWKDYYIESPEGGIAFKQPSCSQAADGMINQLTERRDELKATGKKYFYTIVSPIVQYSRSAYIYYTEQRGFEKYNQLLEEAKVVLTGKEYLIKTNLFDELAQEVLKKDIKDSVTLKSYTRDSQGNFKLVPDSPTKKVEIRKMDRIFIAENLLKADAAAFFCSYDLGRAENGEQIFSNVKLT